MYIITCFYFTCVTDELRARYDLDLPGQNAFQFYITAEN